MIYWIYCCFDLGNCTTDSYLLLCCYSEINCLPQELLVSRVCHRIWNLWHGRDVLRPYNAGYVMKCTSWPQQNAQLEMDEKKHKELRRGAQVVRDGHYLWKLLLVRCFEKGCA